MSVICIPEVAIIGFVLGVIASAFFILYVLRYPCQL